MNGFFLTISILTPISQDLWLNQCENINHNQTIDTKDLHYIVWLRNLEQETYFPVPAEKGRNDVRPREKEYSIQNQFRILKA